MSMVCERGWGGQTADSDWSVRSPHPFWNGVQTSKVVTSGGGRIEESVLGPKFCTLLSRYLSPVYAGLQVSAILEGADLVKDPFWDIFSMLCNSSSPCWQIDRQGFKLDNLAVDATKAVTGLSQCRSGLFRFFFSNHMFYCKSINKIAFEYKQNILLNSSVSVFFYIYV
jgi:hypothetical protein